MQVCLYSKYLILFNLNVIYGITACACAFADCACVLHVFVQITAFAWRFLCTLGLHYFTDEKAPVNRLFFHFPFFYSNSAFIFAIKMFVYNFEATKISHDDSLQTDLTSWLNSFFKEINDVLCNDFLKIVLKKKLTARFSFIGRFFLNL